MEIPSFKIIKRKIAYNFTVELYNFLYYFHPRQKKNPRVLSVEETIDKILSGGFSISRFGDGEMLLIDNKAIGFQKADERLSTRLAEILNSKETFHLVCISDVFNGLEKYTRRAKRFWRTHFYLYGWVWDEYLQNDKTYGNTFVSRPYMDFKDKSVSGGWFKQLKEIWSGRDIVIIEGEKSRLGIGNDFFDNAKSISRILCPAQNAFDKYDEIYKAASEIDKCKLILIALGPTATVLSYDLYKLGFQAIDIGHVDIEYEWFKMNASHKIPISSKYVNEALTGKTISETIDTEYQQQIIGRI